MAAPVARARRGFSGDQGGRRGRAGRRREEERDGQRAARPRSGRAGGARGRARATRGARRPGEGLAASPLFRGAGRRGRRPPHVDEKESSGSGRANAPAVAEKRRPCSARRARSGGDDEVKIRGEGEGARRAAARRGARLARAEFVAGRRLAHEAGRASPAAEDGALVGDEARGGRAGRLVGRGGGDAERVEHPRALVERPASRASSRRRQAAVPMARQVDRRARGARRGAVEERGRRRVELLGDGDDDPPGRLRGGEQWASRGGGRGGVARGEERAASWTEARRRRPPTGRRRGPRHAPSGRAFFAALRPRAPAEDRGRTRADRAGAEERREAPAADAEFLEAPGRPRSAPPPRTGRGSGR
jgi:hypothetical protein